MRLKPYLLESSPLRVLLLLTSILAKLERSHSLLTLANSLLPSPLFVSCHIPLLHKGPLGSNLSVYLRDMEDPRQTVAGSLAVKQEQVLS